MLDLGFILTHVHGSVFQLQVGSCYNRLQLSLNLLDVS